MAFASSIRLQYADDADDLFREYKSPEGAPVEFRIAEVTSIAVVNLPTSIDVRYFRLVIQDYSVAPCLGRMKMMCCTRSECLEVDECANGKNGDCQQKWVNNPGGFVCSCDQGYDLFVENGTAGIHILESETGVRDGDLFRINKICVKKMCPAVCAPQNGHGPVTTLETKSNSTAGSGSSWSDRQRSRSRPVALGTPAAGPVRASVGRRVGRFDCGPFLSS